MACKDLHLGTAHRKVRAFEVGTYPNADGFRYTYSCYHCKNATCIESCSVGAISRADDGTVQLDSDICIGCKRCMANCPLEAIHPAVSSNNKQAMGKCNSCKPLREAGKNPACVDACLMRCLDFGDMDNLIEKYGLGLVSEISEIPALSTSTSASANRPNILVKIKSCALRSDFREVEI